MEFVKSRLIIYLIPKHESAERLKNVYLNTCFLFFQLGGYIALPSVDVSVIYQKFVVVLSFFLI